MRLYCLCFRVFLAFFVSTSVWADRPLTVEEIITNEGETKLELSLNYVNTDRQGVSVGEPIVVQTGPTSFATLPTQVVDGLSNSDSFVGRLGLKHGITSEAEGYGYASWIHNEQRTSGVNGRSNSSTSNFSDAWLGANYQIKGDDETAALLGFAELALYEKHTQSTASLKSFLLGSTAYKTIDPIVFVLTGAYRFNQSRRDGEEQLNPGNYLLVNPSIGFAVNDKITLTTGVQWLNRAAERRNGQVQGLRRTSTDLQLGVGYGIDSENTLNITLSSNVSGRNGSDLRVVWLYTF